MEAFETTSMNIVAVLSTRIYLRIYHTERYPILHHTLL